LKKGDLPVTNCNPKTLPFSSLNRKKVVARFSGGSITSDGGLLLLREIDNTLKLTKKIAQLLSDNRHQSYVDHSIHDFIKQRVMAIAAGYEDLNDHEHLRHDLAFQTAVGRDVKLASPSTLCRFENAITREDIVNINKALVERFIQSYQKPPTQIILDFDSTDYATFGEQELHHYHGHYQHDCFLPLYVFCGDHLLAVLLQPSTVDGADHAPALLKLLVTRLRQVWPTVKIIYRGDAAFGRQYRVVSWCDQHNIDYVLGFFTNSRLKILTEDIVLEAKLQYQYTQEKQRIFSSFEYKAHNWKKSRRIIAKAEHSKLGDNLRFVITSLAGDAQKIYDERYCARGEMENCIKQQQTDMFADRVSCHDFIANQFRLLLSGIAYTLFIELKKTYLPKNKLQRAYCKTLRIKLIKIGAVVIKNTRRIQFLLSSYCPYQNEFIRIAEKLVPI
jgi:Transposase DDE domain group 1